MKHEEMAREPVKPDFIQGTRSTAQFLRANYNDLSRQEAEVIALRLEEAASALAQVEAETLERVIIAVRNERLFGETGTEGDIAYNVALDHAEQAIRALSPNPTPTKGTYAMPDLTKPPTPEQLEAWPPLTKADIELIEDMSGDQLSAVFRGDGERARVLAQVHAKEIAALWPRIVTTAMLLWQTQKLNPTPTKSVVPEGMVMVPREPTDKMLDDGFNALAETHRRGPYGECGGVGWNDAEECYRAMIQAAPNDGAEEE